MYQKQKLAYLQSIFSWNSNDIILLYGDKRAGLYDLIKDFVKDKTAFYYRVPKAEKCLKEKLFIKEIGNQIRGLKYLPTSSESMLDSFVESQKSIKKILIIDEFPDILSDNNTLINYLTNLCSDKCEAGELMIILSTTDLRFVEEELQSALGRFLYEISSVIKITSLDFNACCDEFKHIEPNELISYYSCIGGNLKYWDYVKADMNVKRLIVEKILDTDGMIFNEACNILPRKLRQQSVYHTILYYLANDINKLNDIHKESGIDRAKLMVYLKTLISYGLVSKFEGIAIGDEANIQKGLYYINDPFVRFWYYFIFPNHSSAYIYTPEKFYRKFIEQQFSVFLHPYYVQMCMQCLRTNAAKLELPFAIGEYYLYGDKAKAIDFVIKTTEDESVICSCNVAAPHMSYKDYEILMSSVKKSKIDYKYIMLFSSGGYDQKLSITNLVDKKLLLFNDKRFWVKALFEK